MTMSTTTMLSAAITAIPGAVSFPIAKMVSGQESPTITKISYQTANPIKAAVWREKMAKNSFRHLSGTLQMDTRRSGSGVDITSLPC